MDLDKFEEYNVLIARLNLAEIFLNYEKITEEIKTPYLPKVDKLSKEISSIIKYFKKNKIKYTDEELLNGFNLHYRKARFEKYGY